MSAVEHLLRRIAKDPRLAWYFDPLTESMELLTRDYCKEIDADLEGFRKTYYSTLKFKQEQAFAGYMALKRGDEPFSPGEVSAIQRAFVREQREREAVERGE